MPDGIGDRAVRASVAESAYAHIDRVSSDELLHMRAWIGSACIVTTNVRYFGKHGILANMLHPIDDDLDVYQ